MLARIFWGIIGTIIGFLMIRYANNIYRAIGAATFAEKWFGPFGGTRLLIRLIGLLVIFFSFLTATGLLGPSLRAIVAPLAPGGNT